MAIAGIRTHDGLDRHGIENVGVVLCPDTVHQLFSVAHARRAAAARWVALLGVVLVAAATWLVGQAVTGEVQMSVTATPETWQADQAGSLRIMFRVEQGQLGPGARLSFHVPGSWTAHAMHRHEREAARIHNSRTT